MRCSFFDILGVGDEDTYDWGVRMKLPKTMSAVLLRGHGGLEMLDYCTDVPVPVAAAGEVVIEVAAAGINNTDINTRIGWYSKSISAGTNESGDGLADVASEDGSWAGEPMKFPRIQGADCCGRIVDAGEGVDPARIGERVLARSLLRSYVDYRPFECWTFGSECDGGFAQYAKAPSRETYKVVCDWTDAELASIPCAYSTAEGMLHRAAVGAERVLITGASGGVGSAAVQLCKRRGAEVIALAGESKMDSVADLGANLVLERDTDLVKALGLDSVDVVVDLVAGRQWPQLLDILKRGGRYVTAGAIAGPLVELDVRTLYLKDLSFFGCTFQEDTVFENLVKYIEAGEIKPVVAKTYPLRDIVAAQKDFLAKKYTGKLILIPPRG